VSEILALWCHPRSLSTAFEQMMTERGDVAIVHEPFLYLYYVVQNRDLLIAQQLERIEPWMRAGFDEIVDRIEQVAAVGPVFFKDMAVHVHNPKGYNADEHFLGRFSNAFLIRDPEPTILSHLRQNPEMTFEEVGYDAQFALFEKVRDMTGADPAVIDAADLENNAEGTIRAYCSAMGIPFLAAALQWDATAPAHLTQDDPWHADLFGTRGFESAVESFDPELRGHAKFEEYLERSMPFYEAMATHRIAP